ncbi:MAG: nickel-type superoxide dismutase maturation protease [Chloroflexota bacterium]
MNKYPENAGFFEYVLLLLGRRKPIKVTGASMLPGLKEGDELFVDERAYDNHKPAEGDIVVAWHPREADLKIIKRVSVVFDNGCWLVGDNPAESTDSSQYGIFAFKRIVGKVTSRF